MKTLGSQFGFSTLLDKMTSSQKLMPFLLTPTLSLGEREKRSQFFGKTAAESCSTTDEICQCAQRLFPLPKGEGQGEGKKSFQKPFNRRIALP